MIIPLLVLAILQGLLEFLPVSSEGQILLVAINLYGIDAVTTLSIIFWLHLGTAFTVIIFYSRDIFGSIYSRIRPAKPTDPPTRAATSSIFGPLFSFVLVGTIGTAIVALPLYFFLQQLVTQLMGETVSAMVGVLLMVTGIVLYFQRNTKGNLSLSDISLREAFVLGLIQGVAVLPGISRSGLTLTWLLIRGVNRDEALKLSFLLGVPASIGVTAVDLFFGEVFLTLPFILMMIVAVALFTGLGSLAILRYVAIKAPWWAFCLILGALVLIISIPTIFIIYGISVP